MKQKIKFSLVAALMLMVSLNSLAAITDHFVTTWETTVGNTTITIPTTGTGYNYSIDWEDDNSVDETGITGNKTHDYGAAGTHTIRITGDFPRIFFDNTGDKDKIISIDQWGTNTWTTMRKAFSGASNLVNNATDEPIMATSSSFLQMFLNATSIGTGTGTWDWDTTNVTNMQGMFNNTQFNEDISSWNVENVTSFIGMLSNTTLSTVNYDALLISWDAQSLSANETFDAGNAVYCSVAAQTAHASIIANDGWTINDGGLCNQAPTITTDATIFSPENQVDVVIVTSTDLENDIITYNISASGADSALFSIDSNSGQLTFDNAPDFEMPNSAAGTNTYEVSVQAIDDGTPVNFSVKTINVTVTDVIEFQPEDLFITTWKTDNTVASNVTSITIPTDSSFTYDYHVDWDNDGILDELNITGDITHDFGAIDEYTIAIYGKFPTIKFVNGANKYKIIEINQWGTNPWETFAQSFSSTHNLLNKASDTPNLSNCIDLSYMFAAAFKIGSAQDSGNWDWDVSNVTYMNSMFSGAIVFNKDISMWQTSNVVNMYKMFQGAQDFDQNLSSWDVEAVVSFNDMFIDVTLSSTNYDALLISWDNQTVSQGEGFDGGNSQYCSQAAADARQSLIDNDGWIIIDGGLCNQAPTITTDATIFSPENQVDVVIVTSTDPNGDTVTYSITGGADMSKFTINSTTGQLDFNSEPDFENPTDSGTDNTYVVEITATDDGTGNLSTTKTITVTVTDVLEYQPEDLFKTTWKTDNLTTLSSDSTSIKISTNNNYTYAYQVDWDGNGDFDGADEDIIWSGDATHDYGVAGIYSINIIGVFPAISFNNFNADKEKILSIEQWGTNPWLEMDGAFKGANNIVNNATDTPNLSNCTSLTSMFNGAVSIGNGTGVWNWDTSNVLHMANVFYNATSFNQNISSWNIENITASGFLNFSSLFSGTSLSSSNYDAILIGWNNQNVSSDLYLSSDISIQYCSQAATDARQNLIDNDGWTITDGGRDPSCGLDIIFSNSFENVILLKTALGKVEYDFASIYDLNDTPRLIIIGLDKDGKANMKIHLREDLEQLQIRMSNKHHGNWQIGQWSDIYNNRLTTLEW